MDERRRHVPGTRVFSPLRMDLPVEDFFARSRAAGTAGYRGHGGGRRDSRGRRRPWC